MFCTMQSQHLRKQLHEQLSIAEADNLLRTLKQPPSLPPPTPFVPCQAYFRGIGRSSLSLLGQSDCVINLQPFVKAAWELIQ